jgi:nicotinamide riboside kinase
MEKNTQNRKTVRIAITGPESSGKTSIAQSIASYFEEEAIPEYARLYLTEKKEKYTFEDVAIMASGQFESLFPTNPKKLIVADTEMIVYKIWYQEKYHVTPDGILQMILNQNFDYYFLCYPDIPWEPDPLRENPFDRKVLFHQYENVLKQFKFPYTVLFGSKKERLELALKKIKEIM